MLWNLSSGHGGELLLHYCTWSRPNWGTRYTLWRGRVIELKTWHGDEAVTMSIAFAQFGLAQQKGKGDLICDASGCPIWYLKCLHRLDFSLPLPSSPNCVATSHFTDLFSTSFRATFSTPYDKREKCTLYSLFFSP